MQVQIEQGYTCNICGVYYLNNEHPPLFRRIFIDERNFIDGNICGDCNKRELQILNDLMLESTTCFLSLKKSNNEMGKVYSFPYKTLLKKAMESINNLSEKVSENIKYIEEITKEKGKIRKKGGK